MSHSSDIPTVLTLTDQLRASEARFRDLITRQADGILVVDRDGVIQFTNPAADTLFGRPATELVGRSFGFPIVEAGALDIELRRPGGIPLVVEMRVAPTDWQDAPAWIATLRNIAERRQAEDALREQAVLLVNAQRIGRMGSWSTDLRSGRLIWSEATCDLFGIGPAEFAGTFEHFYSFILAEDRPTFDAAHGRFSSSGLLETEYRIRRPDGAVRWMYERGSIELDATGAPGVRLGMVMDITEQRAAREELAQHVALLRIAGQVARLGGWTIELPERTLTWSDENCAIHDVPPGYTPTLEEGIRYYSPEDRAQVVRYVEVCAQYGTPYDFELPITTAKGRRIWVRSTGEAVRDGEGRIIRIQGAFQDITVQHAAQEALRESEARFKNVARATADTIWDWNFTDDSVWWNDGMHTLFGYMPEDVEPGVASRTSRIHPEERDRVLRSLRHVVEGQSENWSDEYRFRRKDGSYAYVLDRGFVIRSAEGKPLRMVGGMTDLTERRGAETALAESNRALQLLSRCNEAVIRSETEGDLLAAVCQVAVDIGGFRMAWVGYSQDDVHKSIVPQAHAGVEDGYLSRIPFTWSDDNPLGHGPAGRAIRSGEPVVVPDLEAEDSFSPWLEPARAAGGRTPWPRRRWRQKPR